MNKYFKAFCLYLATVALIISITGCNTDNKKIEDDLFTELDLEPAEITFCFWGFGADGQPRQQSSINGMLEELNKKTYESFRTTIKLQWIHYENYDAELIKLLKSGNGPDAFRTYNVEELNNKGLIKDITNLLPQLAPNYYSQLSESWGEEMEKYRLDDKIYGVINNDLFPPQYFIIARQDMVDKYSPDGLSSVEDYGRFLQAIKDKEKDLVPGMAHAFYLLDAYMLGNQYFQANGGGLYFNWNSADLLQIPIERTEAFLQAHNLYRQWNENNLLLSTESREYGNLVNNGHLVSMLVPGIELHQMRDFNISFKYKAYPLYMDSLYESSRSPVTLGINKNSPNADRVIKFLEWLHSNQENYDLFHYGIKDRNYKLIGNALDISGLDYNNVIIDWWGNDALRNFNYERPFPFEPSNYKEFLNTCLNNTFTAREVYKKMGYDLDNATAWTEDEKNLRIEMGNLIQKRSMIYSEFVDQINAGNFTKTLNDLLKEQGGDSITDNIMERDAKAWEKFKKGVK